MRRALRALLCGAAAVVPALLLRPQAGWAGALAPAGCVLLALAALWLAFRVVGLRDVRWLLGLLGAGRKSDD